MIHYCYASYGHPIYITEFGYSKPTRIISFTARRRPQYLLHIVIGGVCHFNGVSVGAELEKNHVAPPSSQDEALSRYSASGEVPR